MTSWEKVGKWYDELVGTQGHYYHKHVILPALLPLLDLSASSQLLDIGCGQGILAHALGKKISAYHGIDLAKSLINKAPKGPTYSYSVADACKKLPVQANSFTHATMILSLQNMEHPAKAIKHAAQALESGGTLVIVLNHPCYRIPRQTHWQIDEQQKIQYRRINRYMTPLQIPIALKGTQTMSFHHSLSDFSQFLLDGGFVIEKLEEWTSDKNSTGRASKMENFARKEFPLFLTLKARLVLKSHS